jgi:hypothetical protein
MKLRILGCSGGIGRDLRTTSMLLDHDILIDAGTGVGDLSIDELCRRGFYYPLEAGRIRSDNAGNPGMRGRLTAPQAGKQPDFRSVGSGCLIRDLSARIVSTK